MADTPSFFDCNCCLNGSPSVRADCRGESGVVGDELPEDSVDVASLVSAVGRSFDFVVESLWLETGEIFVNMDSLDDTGATFSLGLGPKGLSGMGSFTEPVLGATVGVFAFALGFTGTACFFSCTCCLNESVCADC